MKKTLICPALLVLVMCLGAGVTFGQDCDKFNVILKPESTDLDASGFDDLADYFGITSCEPPPPETATQAFGWCWSQQVVGTVQGVWTLCGNMCLFDYDPFGLGIGPELWGNPGFILTKKGDMIYTMSYGLAVWDFDGDINDIDALGGLTTFYGGTGAYDGASGWTTDSPKKYPASYWMQSHGFLCVPD